MDNKKIVTLFNYIGGKSWLRDKLRYEIQLILAKYNLECYTEPFAGGLGAFLNVYDILLENNIKTIILNDINAQIINFYKLVLFSPELLIDNYIRLENQYLKTIPSDAFSLHKIKDKDKIKELLINSNLFFKEVRKCFNKKENNIENAASLLFLQLHCFNGIYRENLKGDYNTPYNWEIRKIDELIIRERILNVHNVLNMFIINFTNLNYNNINYNNKTLYYLDPPYLNDNIKENQYSKIGFNINDQKELIKLCSKSKFIYSNHYNELLINEFYNNNIDIEIKKIFRKNIISSSNNSRKNDKLEMLVSSL